MRLFERLKNWYKLTGITPVSRHFGYDRKKSPNERAQPIDRYYVENFLERHSSDIKGRVLEIGEDIYTKQFGGNRVESAEILDADDENKNAHHIYDLAKGGEGFPDNEFDCFLLIQTLLLIYDVKSAIVNARKLLKPGGVLLATIPGISKICRPEMNQWGDFWRFTNASAMKLFSEIFGEGNVEVETFGNVLSASAYLYGLASHELTKKELDYHDPDYQVTITIRAIKR